MDCNRKGDLTELEAIVWLLKRGYEVFHNVSSVGPIDIVAVDKHTGETIFIDVKYRDDNHVYGRLKEAQEDINVRVLNVSPERIWFSRKPITALQETDW
tara:strand:+ start:642 stop:938 length:297 start_codon:yes stop_codon:yes gene_type:complete